MITKLSKEDLLELHYPHQEVLLLEEARIHREQMLDLLVTLDDEDKVKILFEDSNGLKEVRCVVWEITETYVFLDEDTTIPIHRIHDIEPL